MLNANIIKKNSDVFGFLLALMLSSITYFLLWALNTYVMTYFFTEPILETSLLVIVALGVNMIPLNYYINYQAFKTGRGIMIWVFLFATYIVYEFFGVEIGIRKSNEKILIEMIYLIP